MRVPADYPNEHFNRLKHEASGSDSPQLVNWRNKVITPDATYALQALHNFNGNIQIIESEKDTVVPKQTIQNYINAVKDKSKLTYTVIPGAPHSIQQGPFRDAVEKVLVDWFKNSM